MEKKKKNSAIEKKRYELEKKYGLNNVSFGGLRSYLLKLKETDNVGSDLRGMNLSGADLSGAGLRKSNLSGAKLILSDLSMAKLSGADLSGADLREADLREADLREADLSGADLSGADLSGADLSGADLSGADLREARLSGTNLSNSNFYESKLSPEGLKYAQINTKELFLRSLKKKAKPDETNVLQFSISKCFPVRVFISNEKAKKEVSEAIDSFLANFGIELFDIGKSETGSFFKNCAAIFKKQVSNENFEEDIKKIKHSLELHAIKKIQSESDKNQAEAASTLIQSLKDVENAAIQIGSILVIKCTNSEGKQQICVRTLTTKEMIYIEEHPEIIKDPRSIVAKLSKAKEYENREERLIEAQN